MTNTEIERDLLDKLADARELMEALIIDCPEGHPLRAQTERKINEIKVTLANLTR
jgi:hypothetical protein